MAIESTAINDLIAGFQQQPLQRDSSDWLFGERDDATEIDSGSEEKATTPFDRSTPLPQLARPLAPQLARPTAPPALDALYRSPSPTTYVRPVRWPGIAKKLALPIGVLSIVIVVLGVYFAKTGSTKTAAAAQIEPVAKVAKSDVPPPVAPPVVAPVAQPAQEAKTDEPAPSEEAKSIDVAPLVVEAKPGAAVEETAVVEAKPVEAPKPAEAKPVEEPKPVEPQVVIEPGSPASRFLGTAPTQPTVPTVNAKPKPAPAPTTVPNLPPPPKVAFASPPTAAPAMKPIAKPVAKPAAAKVAKKSAAQVSAEKRAAAKRAAQASVAASKARAAKKVAAAEEEEADEEDTADEAPAKTPEKPAAKGKGVLQIASTPAMEVWVDGRNSGAQTPVRIILLSGKHKVTLFDKENAKTKSFEIEIRPDETTKVVKNYE